jgi:DNA polymerase III epsilon subunit-like protein
MDRFVYVDTETTDKVPGQIAQLAFITVDDTVVIEARNFYFMVGKMSPEAEAIHHLSPAVLKGLSSRESFGDHLCDFGDAFFSDRTFVAHNALFDKRFILVELDRCGVNGTPQHSIFPATICTMQAMTPVCRLKGPYTGKWKWPKVEEALRTARIHPQTVLDRATTLFTNLGSIRAEGALLGFHDARYDVTAVMLIHQWLRENRK